ncbi:dCMP deaminase [Streptomyces sp. WAC06614]|uniref:dCMP deaminase n=1 Tax=Streptomyces sp. WAC06614 TaxID=2487416 RepID=UPI000F793C22|nr:dCMP deaminase [Streptomyces sp. WAC06614]RSS80715.1 dCMP deaminase [Streptomyces sp. WAC06614]
MTPAEDRAWMERAIDLSRKCPPAEGAFSVGAIIVSADGQELASGYSRETDAHVHAEEAALAKLPTDDPRLAGGTIYSTLEPCSERRSRPLTCTQLLLRSPICRVVIAWREPSLLVPDCIGAETLREAGREVLELPDLASAARAVNSHLLIE